MSTYDYLLKFILLGDTAVGKTSIVNRYINETSLRERENEKSMPTLGVDFSVKDIVIHNNITVRLHLWDTSGQERFLSITKNYFRDAAGIMLVFDVLKARSFYGLDKWLSVISEELGSRVPVILVGNKSEPTYIHDFFRNKVTVNECSREISESVAQEFATTRNLYYIETSAKTGDNIQECFNILAEEAINRFKDEKDDAEITGIEGNKIKLKKNGIIKIEQEKSFNCCGII